MFVFYHYSKYIRIYWLRLSSYNNLECFFFYENQELIKLFRLNHIVFMTMLLTN